jgi:fucose permease
MTSPNSVPGRAKSIWKDPIFWLVMGLWFYVAAVFNYLPASFPIFKRVFGSTLEQMGLIQFLFYISPVLLAFGGGWFVGRVGHRRALVISLLLIACSLILMGGARQLTMVMFGAVFFGLGVLAMGIVTCSLLSQSFDDQRQRLFFIYGIVGSAGSTVGPAILGWWLANAERFGGTWRWGYYATAAIGVALMFWPMLLRSIAMPDEKLEEKVESRGFAELKEILGHPAIYLILFLTILWGVTEGGMISFVGQLYQQRFGIDPAEAAYFLSVNSAGFFAGRSLMSWVTSRWKVHELLVLAVCAGTGALGFAATIVSPTYLCGLIMFGVAGVFVSGNGPSINSFTGLRFKDQAATAFAFMAGMSFVGSAGGPYAIGFLGTRFGLESSIWLMPLFALSLCVVAVLWFLRERVHHARLVSDTVTSREVCSR